jgi:hypothetical protein
MPRPLLLVTASVWHDRDPAIPFSVLKSRLLSFSHFPKEDLPNEPSGCDPIFPVSTLRHG